MPNPNTIDWMHYQDIQIDDVPIKKQFDNYISNGQYIDALNLLKNNEDQLKGKVYISEIVAKITNGILFLQNNFNTNVNVFLSDLAQNHKILINSIVMMSPWNETVQYKFYNFTMYNNEIYMAIGVPEIGITPDKNRNWLRLGLRGPSGRPGIDINVKTVWSSVINYKYRDVVAYGGDLYYALKDNIGIAPGIDETTWMLFIKVSKGGVYVGEAPPDQATRDTVWFKTDKDSLTETSVVAGQFYRYNVNADENWDPMYPTTFFKLISGTEVYTDKGVLLNLDIQPEEWKENVDEYIYDVTDKSISTARFVEVIYGSEMSAVQFNYYSRMYIEILNNTATLKLKTRPTVNLPIKILIQ